MPYDQQSKSSWWASMIAIHGSEKKVREVMAERMRKGGKATGPKGFASTKVGKDGMTGIERSKFYGGKRNVEQTKESI